MIIKNLNKSYDKKEIFRSFNLEITEGQVTAVMGGSGVGKTTLLKIIAGLTTYEGEIDTSGEISYVFGEQSLIPALTVKQNLEFAISHVIKDKAERDKRIQEMLSSVGLDREANSYPRELSTGMAQRVSLARGFLFPSNTIIMDEPFRGLDTALKSKLQKLFVKLLEKDKKTVIFITHDINEAVLLADRIIVFGNRPVEIVGDIVLELERQERSLSNVYISKNTDTLLNILENQ